MVGTFVVGGPDGLAPRVDNATATPSAARVYWGALVGGAQAGYGQAPWDMRSLDVFESSVGKRVSILHFGHSFRNSDGSEGRFPAAQMNALRARGVIPFLSYHPSQSGKGPHQAEYQLSDIIAGRHDDYLRTYAASVAAWRKPFFLRFAHEMNGTWSAWSEGVNGNEPGEFVAMWRHVHGIFRHAGATNATWVWCANAEYPGSNQPLSSLYPGDAYVDWTCVDGYNWGTDPAKPGGWKSLTVTLGPTYDLITGTIAPSKPFMIGEVGSTEYGGSKASWLKSALMNELPARFPKLNAFLYFNEHADGLAWQIESSTSATQAFAEGIASSHYAGNEFATLRGSPIRPLGDSSSSRKRSFRAQTDIAAQATRSP